MQQYEEITFKEFIFRLSEKEIPKYIPEVSNEALPFFLISILKQIEVCKKYKPADFITPEKFLPLLNKARNFTTGQFGEIDSGKAENIIKFALLENIIGPKFASEVRRLTQ